jgi:hypothetical protein
MEKDKDCRRFTTSYSMCDDVADIINREQTNLLLMGKFRGRQWVVDRIIREWDQMKRALSSAGTDASDTGKI